MYQEVRTELVQMNFAKTEDICLDAAYGIPHPLKFYLISQWKEVYACDFDNKIEDKVAMINGVKQYCF